MAEQGKGVSVKASVLLITYQQEKTLARALDSVLEQRVPFQIEILVGDDNSTDGTCGILREYQKRYGDRIKVTRHPSNLGASRNLYELLMQAKGEYIAFLEGDDFWCDAKKLEKQIDFLDQETEYTACTHLCRIVDEDGVPMLEQHLDWLFKGEIFTISDFRGLILPGHLSTLMCRRRILEEIENISIIFRANRTLSDRTLALLLAAKGPIFQLQEEMSCYCNHTLADRNNATAMLYERNPNRIQEDLQYTLCLERYTREKLKVDAGFAFHKRDLFVSICWENLRHPGPEARILFRDLFSAGGSLGEYLVYFPVGVWKKLLRRLRRKRSGKLWR